MAIKFETVKPGDVLWSVYRAPIGNTSMSRMDSRPVRIISIDADGAVASTNGNPARRLSRSQIEKLRRSPYKPRAREEVTR